MIGTVTPEREAVLRLRVRGVGPQEEEVAAVLATGYNGYLTLRPSLITALSLPSFGHRRVTLGDGSEVLLAVHEASVIWNSRLRPLQVPAADGDAVIGMALLSGHRITIDVVDGGPVRVDALPWRGVAQSAGG